MRLAVTSDLHGHLPAVPTCDVLVIAGDITPATDHRPGFQAHWLDTAFRGWLDAAPAAHVVAIAGNHDFVFQQRPDAVAPDLRWNYLLDASIVIDDVTFWGSPWTSWFWDWAFNAPKHDPDETFLDARYARAPPETDVSSSTARPPATETSPHAAIVLARPHCCTTSTASPRRS